VLLIVWAVIGFVIPYTPVGQQRKLVMGLHIPLCILCAYALNKLAKRVPARLAPGVACIVLLLVSQSNIRFLQQDIGLLTQGRTVTHYRPFLSRDELSAMRYLRSHAKMGETVLAEPTFSLFAPALAGCQVYYGHWSETPGYAGKMGEWGEFALGRAPAIERTGFLRDRGIRWYVDSGQGGGASGPGIGVLREVFGSGSVRVYRVER
jgi:hypothetical protein